MAKAIKRKDIIEHCAGGFLYNELPENWEGMEQQEFNEFLEENVWEQHEGQSAEWLWEQIEIAADSIWKQLKFFKTMMLL